jgi:hypothetical protein
MSAPNPGDIGLVAIRGRAGRAIRFGQWLVGDGWSDYQHAFVYIGGGEVIEAMPDGARRAAVPTMAGPVAYLRCPEQYGRAVAEAAIGFIDVPYSFTDYLAIALHRVRIPAPHLRAYIETSRRLICSQLCDRAAEIGGWHLFQDRRWHGHVTPGALYRLYEQQEARNR